MRFGWLLLISVAFLSANCRTAAAAPSAPSSSLPDAPVPQNTAADRTTSNASKPYANFYWRTIPPEYRARKLTATGKLKFVGRETINPSDLLPALVSASWGVSVNSNPQYGTNAVAFGERFGAAALRQTSFRLFSDGLLPIAFHEDPRYYRLGRSYSIFRRTRYALTRVFVGRTDAGANTPNYSAILGRALGAGLTPAYYPGVSRNSGVVIKTFGTAIAGEMGLDFLREFLPGTWL
ncbi:MAG: hypothetical protein ACYDC6_06695 [Acidobacteriaceae bacterium]